MTRWFAGPTAFERAGHAPVGQARQPLESQRRACTVAEEALSSLACPRPIQADGNAASMGAARVRKATLLRWPL
jgi:hypothetical protein